MPSPVMPPRNERQRRDRTLTVVALFGTAVLWVAFFRPIWDVDVFWHIAAGRWIWDHNTLPKTDIFSAADQNRPWYTFQWLYELLVYFLSAWGGLWWVRFVSSIVVISAFVVYFRRFREYVGPLELVLLLISLLVVLYSDRVRVRPHILNFLFMATALPIFWGTWRNRRRLGGLALRTAALVGLWANLHAGGALMFLVVLLALPAGEFLAFLLRNKAATSNGEHRVKEACLFWLGSALVAAAMPHFVSGNVQAITMLDASRPLIDEWIPPWGYVERFLDLSRSGKTVYSLILTGISPYIAFLAIISLIFARFMRRGWESVVGSAHPTEWLFAIGASFIAMSSARFAWWSILTFAVVTRIVTGGKISRTVQVAALIGTVVLSAVAWQRYFTAMAGSFTATVDTMSQDIDEPRFPITAADFLEAAEFSGDIWCLPNWGGYLLWRLHPTVRVLSDGRGNFDHKIGEELLLVYEQRFHDRAYEAVSSAYARLPNIDAVVIQPPGFGKSPPPKLWKTVLKTGREEIYYRIRPENQANIDKADMLLQKIAQRRANQH